MSLPCRRLPARVFIIAIAWLMPFAAIAAAAEPSPLPTPLAAGSPQAASIRFQISIHYLAAPAEDPVLAAREQARRDARRLKLVHQLPPQPTEPVMSATLRNAALSTSPPANLPAALQGAQRALLLEFAHPRARASDALRVATRLAEQVARETGGLLWDDGTQELFTADEWRRSRADAWVDESIDVARHVALQQGRSGETLRIVTRGMAKFGLPEIAVERVPAAAARAMGELIQGVAQAWAEGATLPRDGEFDLDLRSLRQPDAHARQSLALRAGAGGVAKLSLVQMPIVQIARDEGEARLVELRFDRQPGADLQARQLALLNVAYGRSDAMPASARTEAADDPQRASAAARARLPALREAFSAGLPARETIQLKAPFATADGGTEWMWVEVLSWSGDAVVGVLKSQPRLVSGLAVGQIVNLRQREVVDYLHRHADGTQEGNATAASAPRAR